MPGALDAGDGERAVSVDVGEGVDPPPPPPPPLLELYVNVLEVVPPAVETETAAVPAEPAGVVKTSDVPEFETIVAATPPTVTVAPDRFVPDNVTIVPPEVVPEDGDSDEMVGAVAE